MVALEDNSAPTSSVWFNNQVYHPPGSSATGFRSRNDGRFGWDKAGIGFPLETPWPIFAIGSLLSFHGQRDRDRIQANFSALRVCIEHTEFFPLFFEARSDYNISSPPQRPGL